MLIQKDLEAKVITLLTSAFTTANVSAPYMTGAWQSSQNGLIKWVQTLVDSDACISLSATPPNWGTFSTPVVSVSFNLTLFVRPELDVDGTRLAAVATVIEDLLRGWQTSTYQQEFTALDVPGFSADGISLNGGTAPTLVDNFASVTWNFTISGSYQAVTAN